MPYSQEERLLGVTREQLLRIPHKIGIASGEQADSIVGAARSKFIDTLITDTRTAEVILAKHGRS